MFVKMARAHSKVEQGEETAKILISIGYRLFSERGYHAVAAATIVSMAGLTRGALYHHFDGKRGLFEAVFRDCERKIATRIENAADLEQTAHRRLVAGSLAFLEACADPALKRIVVEDAPTVLGWSKWRQIDADHGLALLRRGIEALKRDGSLNGYDSEALVYLLSGAMNELAMWVAESEHADSNLRAAKQTLTALIRALTN